MYEYEHIYFNAIALLKIMSLLCPFGDMAWGIVRRLMHEAR